MNPEANETAMDNSMDTETFTWGSMWMENGTLIIDVLEEENEEGDENQAEEDEAAEEQEMDDANNEQVILRAEEIDSREQDTIEF